MSKEDLAKKAIDIKGKKYVLVSDRIVAFNEAYPNGCIVTERTKEGEMEVIKATVFPDADNQFRFFTGYSQATWGEGYINVTSALENAETSAVGRALAMMGIGIIDSIASADEMKKTTHVATGEAKPPYKPVTAAKEELPWMTPFEFEDMKNRLGNGLKEEVREFMTQRRMKSAWRVILQNGLNATID